MATLVDKGEQSAQAIQDANVAEVDRLSAQHYVVKNAMGGKLVLAPIDLSKPDLRILDSATADGLWLRDLQLTTSSPTQNEYVGTDTNIGLFPRTPTPSVTLVKQSLAEPQPADWAGTFDLVNQRFAFAAAMSAPLQPIVSNLAALLKPGGWLQSTEMDLSAAQGDAMIKVTGLVKRVLTMVKGPMNITSLVPELMKDAGLTEVDYKDTTVLVGSKNPDPEMKEESIKSMVMTVEGLVAAAAHMPPGAMGENIGDLPKWVESELKENGGSWKIRTVWGKKL